MSAITIAEAARASENRISTRETIETRSLCLLSSKGETERFARYLCASERERAAIHLAVRKIAIADLLG
jgi:hypothetical protein